MYKKEKGRVFFYDKIWLLPLALDPCFYCNILQIPKRYPVHISYPTKLVQHIRELQSVLLR